MCVICIFKDAKRLIGRKFEDDIVQDDIKHWPFEVINHSGKPKIQVKYLGETRTFFPEEVNAVLRFSNNICVQINFEVVLCSPYYNYTNIYTVLRVHRCRLCFDKNERDS